MKAGVFQGGNTAIDFFNEHIAKPAGVAPINYRRYIPVDTEDDTTHQISVWRKVPATELDKHMGTNEDGFRWRIVHAGTRTKPNYKPF